MQQGHSAVRMGVDTAGQGALRGTAQPGRGEGDREEPSAGKARAHPEQHFSSLKDQLRRCLLWEALPDCSGGALCSPLVPAAVTLNTLSVDLLAVPVSPLGVELGRELLCVCMLTFGKV